MNSQHRCRVIALVLIFMTAQACRVQPEAPVAASGIFPGDSWPVATPESQGINPAVIDSIHAEMQAGLFGNMDHFLLIRNGYVVADYSYEQDYEAIAAHYDTTNYQYNYDHPDWHPFYQGTKLHTLQSVTKSITSAALGIAVDEGLLDAPDTPMMSMFEGYEQDFSDARRAQVTLEDLLTMRAGIDWNEMIAYSDSTNSCIIMEASDAWIQYVLDQPMREEPGYKFDYNSGVSVLLGKLVGMATGMRVDQWTQERLFEPIGIDEYYWKITPDNEVDTEGGLYLTTHDLARIGYLFLNDGMWEGEQIISQEWVRTSISPVVDDVYPDVEENDTGYGYQWWVPGHNNGQTKIFAGNGYGGQFVLVAPEYDIVAVFYSCNIHDRPEKSTYSLLQQRILPAVVR